MFLISCAQRADDTTTGGKTSSFKVRGGILSVIQAGFPFVEKEGGMGGRRGERRHRGGKRRRELETAAGQCVSVRTDDEGEDGRKQGEGRCC